MGREISRLKRPRVEVVMNNIDEQRKFGEVVDLARRSHGVRLKIIAEEFDSHIKRLSSTVLARTRLGYDTSEAIARELGWDFLQKEKLVHELKEYILRKRRIKLERDTNRLPPDLKNRILAGESLYEEIAAFLRIDVSNHTQYLEQLVKYTRNPLSL